MCSRGYSGSHLASSVFFATMWHSSPIRASPSTSPGSITRCPRQIEQRMAARPQSNFRVRSVIDMALKAYRRRQIDVRIARLSIDGNREPAPGQRVGTAREVSGSVSGRDAIPAPGTSFPANRLAAAGACRRRISPVVINPIDQTRCQGSCSAPTRRNVTRRQATGIVSRNNAGV